MSGEDVEPGGLGSFRAFVARNVDGTHARGIEVLPTALLGDDGVLVRVLRSSVNYKDALAANPDGRVARISPLVVGIDLVGEVVESPAGAFRPGELVVASGHELGVSRHGGFAELARVPPDWLVTLPPALDPDDAMTIGTAGYTAALSIIELEERGLDPDAGPVLVTGATGGVGSVAVSLLAGLGYRVVASTGKADRSDWLRSLGAADVIDREAVSVTPKPMMPAEYAGAVDCVGSTTLAGAIARLRPGAAVAACGNTGGADLPTSVLPFILRGVALLGIDSVNTPMERRRQVWHRLSTDMRPGDLASIRKVVGLSEVDAALDEIADGSVVGRYVVDTTA